MAIRFLYSRDVFVGEIMWKKEGYIMEQQHLFSCLELHGYGISFLIIKAREAASNDNEIGE